MNVIIVDDELLAIDYLDLLLQKLDHITVSGKYNSPADALEVITKQKIDIAFLDIFMPIMSGIDLAKEITKISPHTQIVFTTAHKVYAIEAFELHAVDYLLKPYGQSRLEEAIKRCEQRMNSDKIPTPDELPFMVCAFDSLAFFKNRSSNESIQVKWRTTKVRGIFSFLLYNQGKLITKDLLVELFWESEDIEKSFTQLYNSIYQVRKALTDNQIPITILNVENGYILKLNNIDYDVDIFEQGVQNLPKLTAESLHTYLELIHLYRGDFFHTEEYIWAENSRERLRLIWIKLINKVCNFYEDEGNVSDAIALYLHLQSLYPYYENSYLRLVKLYQSIGNYNDAKLQYNHLAKMLKSESDGSLNEEIDLPIA